MKYCDNEKFSLSSILMDLNTFSTPEYENGYFLRRIGKLIL
jgi:hypothetical protein